MLPLRLTPREEEKVEARAAWLPATFTELLLALLVVTSALLGPELLALGALDLELLALMALGLELLRKRVCGETLNDAAPACARVSAPARA